MLFPIFEFQGREGFCIWEQEVQQTPSECYKQQEGHVSSVPAQPALQSEIILHFELVHSGLYQRPRSFGMNGKDGRLGFLEVLGRQWQHTLLHSREIALELGSQAHSNNHHH